MSACLQWHVCSILEACQYQTTYMLKLRLQYQTHLVTLVVSDRGLLIVPSVTPMNDHNGKVAGTLAKPFFLFVIEQQVCLT